MPLPQARPFFLWACPASRQARTKKAKSTTPCMHASLVAPSREHPVVRQDHVLIAITGIEGQRVVAVPRGLRHAVAEPVVALPVHPGHVAHVHLRLDDGPM